MNRVFDNVARLASGVGKEASFAAEAEAELSPDGTFNRVSNRYAQLLGYAPQDLLGRHHKMTIDRAHEKSAEYARLWSELSKGERQEGAAKRIGAGGVERWLYATYQPEFDSAGRPRSIRSTVVDITSIYQRLIEAERLAGAADVSAAILKLAPDGKIEDANDVFQSITGYGCQELQNRNLSEFLSSRAANDTEL
ncbi:MAG: PAS domain S-box protein, partial [Pseudomonadota bacterium]